MVALPDACWPRDSEKRSLFATDREKPSGLVKPHLSIYLFCIILKKPTNYLHFSKKSLGFRGFGDEGLGLGLSFGFWLWAGVSCECLSAAAAAPHGGASFSAHSCSACRGLCLHCIVFLLSGSSRLLSQPAHSAQARSAWRRQDRQCLCR